MTRLGVQLLGVQRPVMIGIRGIETLLDQREIFVLGEGAVVVRIGGGQFFRRQSAGELSVVERAVMVAFQSVERA